MRALGGTRLEWSQLPTDLQRWVEDLSEGPPTVAKTQIGGLSAGCALRLEFADGSRAFLKAIGDDINADTAGLFRYETALLAELPDVSYRARLLSTYDESGWIGLLLKDVEGRHPDLGNPADFALVAKAVERQTDEFAASRAPDVLAP